MKKNSSSLTIIIVNWNTAAVTQKCIQSIYKYFPKLKYEIIVVDNGSKDNSVLLLKKQCPQVTLIENTKNLGYSSACNQGAKKASSKYLLFLNSDMLFFDDSIKYMLNFLVNHKNAGLVGPRFLNPDKTPQGSIFPPQTVKNAIREYVFGQINTYTKYFLASPDPKKVWAISGGAVMIEKKLFEKIGGWDERYFMYFEDLALCRQITKLGHDIYYFPQTSVIHFHGLSGRNTADPENQWKRLIPSSKIYHGLIYHYILTFVLWLSQKLKKFLS